jgi:cob(I)alamin adenosyltransferase
MLEEIKSEILIIQQSLGEIKYYLLKDKKYYLAQQIVNIEHIINEFKKEVKKWKVIR